MSIGENIKRIRKEKGLTQKQLGKLCNPQMDEANIRKYENNKQNPKIETIRKIATALNVNLSELIDDWNKYTEEEISKNGSSAKLSHITVGTRTFEHAGDFHDYLFEKVITDNLKLLNKEGKMKLSNYSTDLTKIPEYQKKDE